MVTWLMCVQVEDVREELLERSKVLPGLSSRLTELEKLTEELRDKNRLTDQKIVNMQVRTHKHTHTRTRMHSHPHTHSQTHALAHAHSHTRAHSRTHVHSHTRALSHSLSHTPVKM